MVSWDDVNFNVNFYVDFNGVIIFGAFRCFLWTTALLKPMVGSIIAVLSQYYRSIIALSMRVFHIWFGHWLYWLHWLCCCILFVMLNGLKFLSSCSCSSFCAANFIFYFRVGGSGVELLDPFQPSDGHRNVDRKNWRFRRRPLLVGDDGDDNKRCSNDNNAKTRAGRDQHHPFSCCCALTLSYFWYTLEIVAIMRR